MAALSCLNYRIFSPTDFTWSIQHVQYTVKLKISPAALSGKEHKRALRKKKCYK